MAAGGSGLSNQARVLGEEFFKDGPVNTRWEVGEVLGSARYCEFFAAVSKRDSSTKAVLKKYPFNELDAAQIRNVNSEIVVQKKITRKDEKHCCQHLYEVAVEGDTMILVVERLSGDDLFDRLSATGGLPESEVRKHVSRMVDAVILFQKEGCAHRNIKPENFKFTEKGSGGHLRLCNFSFGYYTERPGRKIRQLCGTPPYLPPEICTNDFYKPDSADIWSLGVTFFVMFSSRFPFGDGSRLDPLFRRIQFEEPQFTSSKWAAVSTEAKEFIKSLLQKRPEDRPTALQVAENPFVRNSPRGDATGVNKVPMNQVNARRAAVDERKRPQLTGTALRYKWRSAIIKVIAINRMRQFIVEETEEAEIRDGEIPSLPKEALQPIQDLENLAEVEPPNQDTVETAPVSRFEKASATLFTRSDVKDRWEMEDRVLGKGAFGEVVTGRSINDPKTQVAIKRMRLTGVPESQLSLFEGECLTLRLLSEVDTQRRLLRAYEVSEENDTLSIVLELCRGGQLFDRIVNKGIYSEMDAARDVRKMLEDVKFMHSLGIAHRDIKPENFMFTEEGERGQLKIIDFGFATYSADPNKLVNDFLGTFQYLPPEIVLRRWYDPRKADMWSLGVVVYVMFSGRFPFGNTMGRNMEPLFRRILYKDPDFRGGAWVHISEACKNFVLSLLNKNAAKRPTAEEALNHPWLRSRDLSTQSLKTSVNELHNFQIRSKFRVALFRMVAIQGIGGKMYNASLRPPETPAKDKNSNPEKISGPPAGESGPSARPPLPNGAASK